MDKDKTPEGVSRYENVQELLNAIKDFVETNKANKTVCTLDVFMQDVALLTDQDFNDNKDDHNKVTLMTIHAAKGLEFPFVYVVGLEENLFPSQLSVHSREELEEERRLFYVAITRAKEFLNLSYATSRWRWGQLSDCEPSRFLNEIDDHYLDWQYQERPSIKSQQISLRNNISNHFSAKKTTIKKPLTSSNYKPHNLTKANVAMNKIGHHNNNQQLQTGMIVMHERFGQGKILQIEGTTDNKKATIFFEGIGQKVLLLKFAKLSIIE